MIFITSVVQLAHSPVLMDIIQRCKFCYVGCSQLHGHGTLSVRSDTAVDIEAVEGFVALGVTMHRERADPGGGINHLMSWVAANSPQKNCEYYLFPPPLQVKSLRSHSPLPVLSKMFILQS